MYNSQVGITHLPTSPSKAALGISHDICTKNICEENSNQKLRNFKSKKSAKFPSEKSQFGLKIHNCIIHLQPFEVRCHPANLKTSPRLKPLLSRPHIWCIIPPAWRTTTAPRWPTVCSRPELRTRRCWRLPL